MHVGGEVKNRRCVVRLEDGCDMVKLIGTKYDSRISEMQICGVWDVRFWDLG
jgi:hypothetical protein